MADVPNNKVALDILLQTLKENPELWETRKKTATLLFADKQYEEAADIVWNAPKIPSTDIDVAFALRVISRVKPNRSIRLVYEVLKRNKDKPLKNMAVARALNDAGLYMEAARFYGAALADDTSLFDVAFERQVLWLDDSGRLLEEWHRSDQDSKPPLDVPEQDITGGALDLRSLPKDTQAEAVGHITPLPGTKPLMMNSAATPQTSPLATAPAGTNARPLAPIPVSPAGAHPLRPAASQRMGPMGPMGPQTSPLSVNPLGNMPAQPMVPPSSSAPALRRAAAGMQQPTPSQPMVPRPNQQHVNPGVLGMGPEIPVYPQPVISPQNYAMPGAVPSGYPRPSQPLAPGYPVPPPRPDDQGPKLRLK